LLCYFEKLQSVADGSLERKRDAEKERGRNKEGRRKKKKKKKKIYPPLTRNFFPDDSCLSIYRQESKKGPSER
jgi:hypothetical protein